MQWLRTLLCAATLTGFPFGAELDAQQSTGNSRRPTRVPVMLALVDTLTGDAPFRILRRADVTPHDVILFRAGADWATLSAAVQDLLSIRRVQGDTTRSGAGAMRVRQPGRTAAREVRMLPWARRVMEDLRRADSRVIAGVGTVPSVQIWLPPQRRPSRQP